MAPAARLDLCVRPSYFNSITSALAAPAFTAATAFSASSLVLKLPLDDAMVWPFVAFSRQRWFLASSS